MTILVNSVIITLDIYMNDRIKNNPLQRVKRSKRGGVKTKKGLVTYRYNKP